MKYFICALDNIYLGIPTGQIQRVMPVTRIQTSVFETENDDVFISIPALLCPKDAACTHSPPHGLVLKSAACSRPGRTILLAPRIDIDLEIPEENIRRLPEAFVGVFSFFRGACFTDDSYKMILILDPEKLAANSMLESKK